MRNCCAVHSAVGCSVTFQCKMRRLPTSRTTKTYSTRKDAVTTMKKSVASTDRAWFRTNVLHACVPRRGLSRHDSMYRLTVRGETRIPSFTRSSAAIRSSPHVRLATAIVLISRCRSAGIGGRPGARDFQRHQPESLLVPTDQRLRLDRRQQLPPLEEPPQRDERDACGVIGAA